MIVRTKEDNSSLLYDVLLTVKFWFAMIMMLQITSWWVVQVPHPASIKVVYMKVKRTGAKPRPAMVDWTSVPPSTATN